jgi:glycosyltransferase involved in cell wall biosynthesis
MSTSLPNIIACIVVYNDIKLLPDCLKSLERADRIIIVDGAYKEYPHEKPYSTDGTIELIKKLARNDKRIDLIECKKAWKDEIEKRNACFQGTKGDWYLIIDSDEVLGGKTVEQTGITPLRQFLETSDADCVEMPIYSPFEGGYDRAPRVFRHRDNISYRYTHYLIFYGEELWKTHPIDVFDGSTLWHMPHVRSKDRKEKMTEYGKKLTISELDTLEGLIKHATDHELDKDSTDHLDKLRVRHRDWMEKRGWLS